MDAVRAVGAGNVAVMGTAHLIGAGQRCAAERMRSHPKRSSRLRHLRRNSIQYRPCELVSLHHTCVLLPVDGRDARNRGESATAGVPRATRAGVAQRRTGR